jgi:predicted TIM-barrel fold metal-dependent hydrolase
MLHRREFLGAALAAIPLKAEWSSPVLDIHFHPRHGDVREIDHLNGAGIAKAVFLPSLGSEERVARLAAESPARFVRFCNADVRLPDTIGKLRAQLNGGAIGMGELKYPVEIDGPEMRRVYDLAAAFRVPVLMHYQEGSFNSGFARLPALLKAYPKTIFIGHANSWWAHISGEVNDRVGYPTGPVKPGGITDRVLADYPNIYGDLSANSGRNALARDPDFAAAFLARHQSKLLFGSDCPCRDGMGAGQTGAMAGKCIARETLTLLTRMTSAEAFHRIVWENGNMLLKLST